MPRGVYPRTENQLRAAPANLAKAHTAEARAKAKAALREIYKDPEVIERVRSRTKEALANPAVRETCRKCKSPPKEGFSHCETCLEKRRKERRKRYAANPAAAQLRNKLLNERVRKETLKAYGDICACCGDDYLPYLELDHVNNDGAQQRFEALGRKRSGGSPFFYWLKKNGYPDCGLQVLCANCHVAKTRGQPCKGDNHGRNVTCR